MYIYFCFIQYIYYTSFCFMRLKVVAISIINYYNKLITLPKSDFYIHMSEYLMNKNA